mmetsp:Transcript_12039/g.39320  ORF Transcript_12039/g.39320 Transcript_12039/m.39320 type:complete len:253 (+) Transcript_12039:1447-2205(+)
MRGRSRRSRRRSWTGAPARCPASEGAPPFTRACAGSCGARPSLRSRRSTRRGGGGRYCSGARAERRERAGRGRRQRPPCRPRAARLSARRTRSGGSTPRRRVCLSALGYCGSSARRARAPSTPPSTATRRTPSLATTSAPARGGRAGPPWRGRSSRSWRSTSPWSLPWRGWPRPRWRRRGCSAHAPRSRRQLRRRGQLERWVAPRARGRRAAGSPARSPRPPTRSPSCAARAGQAGRLPARSTVRRARSSFA